MTTSPRTTRGKTAAALPLSPGGNRKIEPMPISRLKPYANNARTHSKSQITKIARSLETFGFVNPVLIDEANQIIAGHGRVEAAKQIGLKRVPTLRIDHLSAAEKRAYILADNRLAEDAGWDKELLAIELQGDVSPLFHPPEGRVCSAFEPFGSSDATGRGAEPPA